MSKIDSTGPEPARLDAVDGGKVAQQTTTDTDKLDIREVETGVGVDSNDKGGMDRSKVDRELAQYVSDVRVHVTAEKSAELRRKIDRRVLVVMIATYFLQALDKGTMSFASIMGIVKDTDLHGQEYSWLTTCIYITILVVEYPQNWILARVPMAKYLSFSIVAWGTVLACTAACRSFGSLVAVRTLLGLFESACQPAFVLLSGTWYRRDEQAARVTYWYMMNGAQQVVGGLLAYCFSLIPPSGALRSWQWLFLVYGLVSVLFGLFVGWWMPDSPMRARCWSEADKRLMVERVRDNQTGIQNRAFKEDQAVEALADPQVWGYALVAFCTTLPTSGLGAFQGIIIQSFGFSTLQTQLLAMVLGFYIVAVLLGSVRLVRRTGQNLLVMLAFCVPSFVGTVCLMVVPLQTTAQRAGLLVCYYITLSFWSAQTLALSMISRNIAGQTKKSVAVALNFIFWSAGNAVGPQVFLSWNRPRYFVAFATHLGCYSLLVLVLVGLRVYLVRENGRRDRLAAAGLQDARDEQCTHAWEDLTDRQNRSFRYVY